MELAINAHLAWISQNPRFVPYNFVIIGSATYLDTMRELYCSRSRNYMSEDIVNRLFRGDLLHHQQTQSHITQLLKQINKDDKNEFFITIGFNHQTYTISQCVKVIESILTFDWILSCRAVFEFYRENGEHPHVHFYITSCIKYRSKIIEKLWATKGIKQVCLKKSFIDCKNALEYHKKYIMLNKTESKLPYIEKDKIWRLENSIPEFFIK